jgi:serine-type D-Ala-D-Ala carboxypeptidase/endopeptidase (penicillin-binding protein 4)
MAAAGWLAAPGLATARAAAAPSAALRTEPPETGGRQAVPPDLRGLPAPLRDVIAGAGLPLSCFGLQVQAVDDAALPLAALNAEQAYQLASTTKVVTALAALDLLGSQYRWRTYAFLGGPLVEGRLLGDLLIIGGGNATLRSADLLAWFTQMQAQGLREVWGDIVLDRDAFRLTEADHVLTPLPASDRPHHARPDALMLDEGVLRITVSGHAVGGPAVLLTPPMAGLQVTREVSAGNGCSVWAQMLPPPRQGLGALPPAPRLRVVGQWGPRCGSRELVMAPWSHDEFSTRAVQGLWRQSGGGLKGRVVDRPRPERDSLLPRGADGEPVLPWAIHQSEPLPQVIRDINKTSDNLGARNLMLSLVRGFPLRSATLAEARERIAGWLERQGLEPGDIAVDNGSGLSRAERGKPRAMVQLLRQAWASRQAQDFIDSLPIAGVDGTLAHRMTHGRATGAAFLKTGTLLDTRALAGYVRAVSGRTHAVTALVNHPQAQRATPALDALIEWVARHG